jgi:quercetin dioxygenase-like cupin family protein
VSARLPGSFTSRDFGSTKSALSVEVPERLIHRGVESAHREHTFSSERRHDVWVVDLPSRAVSMTIGTLEAGQSANRHRHTYETIIYVLEGDGETTIEGVVVEWSRGDAIYIPQWAWHHHRNRSTTHPCRYLAAENAPMLQNIGLALREEA